MTFRKHIDASIGIPAYSLTALANYAFDKKNLATLNQDKLIDNISEYFLHRGFKSHTKSQVLSSDEIAVTSGGTTQGFELIIDLLSQDIEQENQNRKDRIKPVMLMPTPTYGVFKSYPESKNIEVITVPRNLFNSGKLDLNMLDKTISSLNQQGKRVVAYYDANPHNPLGIVRGKAETSAIASILTKHSNQYLLQDKKFAKCNKITQWKGPASRIRTIDDMVSDGLEYGSNRPFSFAQLDDFSKDAFATFGTSKVGPFSVKAGLVIGNRKDIKTIRNIQSTHYPAVKNESLLLLGGYFNLHQPFFKRRRQFLKELSKTHKFSGLLMKALINGIDTVAELDDKDKQKIINLVARHTNQSNEKALARIQKGIKGVTVITSPKAGFFHMLDFKELKLLLGQNNNHADPLHSLLTHANVSFRGGDKIGLPDDEMIVRTTFAMPAKDIIDLTDRLEKSIQYMVNKNTHSLKLN